MSKNTPPDVGGYIEILLDPAAICPVEPDQCPYILSVDIGYDDAYYDDRYGDSWEYYDE